MGRRTWVIVGVGLVVLVAVAGIGARAYLRADGWEDQDIADLALSADRTTLYVLADPYLSASCYEGRAEVTTGEERWTVELEARRTSEFCTMEGCIGGDAPPDAARQLGPGESLGCTTATVELDEAVPPGVEVVAG